MLYSCNHVATVGVKGLMDRQNRPSRDFQRWKTLKRDLRERECMAMLLKEDSLKGFKNL